MCLTNGNDFSILEKKKNKNEQKIFERLLNKL